MDATPITDLVVNGSGLTLDVAKSITDMVVDETTAEKTQVTITISDPGFDLLESGLFAKGAKVRYSGLDLQVATVGTKGDNDLEQLVAVCWNRGVIALESEHGSAIVGNETYDVTYTQFLAQAAARVGLKFHGQPDPSGTTSVLRTAEPGHLESTWDVGVQAAQEIGFWIFESAGSLYFGKPSWLLATSPTSTSIGWKGSAGATNDSLTVPEVERFDIPGQTGIAEAATVEVTVPLSRAMTMRAGSIVKFSGVPGFAGRYLVVQNRWKAGTVEPATVTLAAPIDPLVVLSPASVSTDVADVFPDGATPPSVPAGSNPDGPFHGGLTKTRLIDQARGALQRWSYILDEEKAQGLPAYLLLAVGSAETNLTNVVSAAQTDSKGRVGHGHGVWQLDDRSHTIDAGFDNDVKAQCRKAAAMLRSNFGKYGDWRVAVRHYNGAGPAAEAYADDVVARRQCLENNAGQLL